MNNHVHEQQGKDPENYRLICPETGYRHYGSINDWDYCPKCGAKLP